MGTGHATTTATAPHPRGRSGRWVLLGVLAVLVLACALIAIPALRHRPYVAALDDFGPVPPFTFTDETGHAFTDRALTGKVSIVNFIFTRCDAICPASTAHML